MLNLLNVKISHLYCICFKKLAFCPYLDRKCPDPAPNADEEAKKLKHAYFVRAYYTIYTSILTQTPFMRQIKNNRNMYLIEILSFIHVTASVSKHQIFSKDQN